MANQKRTKQLHFRVSEDERERIKSTLSKLGTKNMEAYLRRMALTGYVIKLELPELHELTSLLRINSNNINQIAKRVNETGRIYAEDMDEILHIQEKIWEGVHGILMKLSTI